MIDAPRLAANRQSLLFYVMRRVAIDGRAFIMCLRSRRVAHKTV